MTASVSAPSNELDISPNSKRNALIQLMLVIITVAVLGGYYGTVAGVTLILIFTRIENQSLGSLGFRRQNWLKLLLSAIGAAVLIQVVATIINVILVILGAGQPDLSTLGSIEGNLGLFLFYLSISWSIAGFGEEIVWRGFFMTKFAQLFDNSKLGWRIAVVLSGLIFGSLHLYQGWAGAIQVAIAGMIFAYIFLRSRQNLWLCILAHGFIDTIAFVLLYVGVL